MSVPRERYPIDPDDPRAPPAEVWERMSPVERRRVVDELPGEFEPSEASPPEGDHHQEIVDYTRHALRDHFRRLRRRIYIGNDLPVYYPGERMFSPDLLAVVDVEDRPRESWVVSAEGKGLDLAMEIHWLGHRLKDFDRNVAWFARLGIPEYFVFDARRLRLRGFASGKAGAPYRPVVPQGGRLPSQVLGLELGIEGERLRFYSGNTPLPGAEELVARLDSAMEEAVARAGREAERADDAERRLAEALAEIERLRGGKGE